MTEVYTFGLAMFRVRDILLVRYEHGTEEERSAPWQPAMQGRVLSHCVIVTLMTGKEVGQLFTEWKQCEAVLNDIKMHMERLDSADHTFINSKLPVDPGAAD